MPVPFCRSSKLTSAPHSCDSIAYYWGFLSAKNAGRLDLLSLFNSRRRIIGHGFEAPQGNRIIGEFSADSAYIEVVVIVDGEGLVL